GPDKSVYLVVSEEATRLLSKLIVQRFSGEGELLWGQEGMRAILRDSRQTQVECKADGLGHLLLGWKDYWNEASEVHAQRIDFSGRRLWGDDGVIVTAPAGMPSEPIRMASLGQGASGFAWTEVIFEEPTVLVARITPEGSIAWDPKGQNVTPRRTSGRNPAVGGDS